MNNKNIIIILLVIIVILAVAIGMMLLNPTNAKEPTQIKIMSDNEQYEGGELSIQLTDMNKTPLSKEVVNITITNSKDKIVVDNVVKTNSKGEAKFNLELSKGNYNVTVSYDGNENYTGNNTTQNLKINEEIIEATSTQSYDNNQDPSYYDKITVDVDPESGGSIIDLSQLSDDEYAQYLGYSDAEEMERETARKRAETLN